MDTPRSPTVHAAAITTQTSTPDSSVSAATANVTPARQVDQPAAARQREVQRHQHEHGDLEEVIDREGFADEAEERVQAGEHRQRDDGGRGIEG